MKVHLALPARHLEKSVAFYSTLLDVQPQKVLGGYALFVADDPPLELALNADEVPSAIRGAHFGLCVETAEEVNRAEERLRRAGMATAMERETTCCYANQTKVWTTDPDGRRWEIYTVHADTEERSDAAVLRFGERCAVMLRGVAALAPRAALGLVQRHGLSNERGKGTFVEPLAFMEIDRAPKIAV